MTDEVFIHHSVNGIVQCISRPCCQICLNLDTLQFVCVYVKHYNNITRL